MKDGSDWRWGCKDRKSNEILEGLGQKNMELFLKASAAGEEEISSG